VNPRAPRPWANGGFSYVEVLVAVGLLALCVVPTMEALQTGVLGAAVHQSETADHYAVAGRLEEVLAEPFASLDAAATAAGGPTNPSSYSASPLLVYLARYDGDNADGDGNPFTGGDDGLLWVRVAVENGGAALETLTTR
jgi:type II secretory pathway pseudopilin PulG